MNMMKLLLSALLLSAGIIAQAQKYTISGYVTDSRSGEPLIGVAVIDSGTSLGTTTGNSGYYSISLGQGRKTLGSSISATKKRPSKSTSPGT